MRTPLGIGLLIGAAILLTLVALVHLTINPRKTGRWMWLLVIVLLPVLGPLLYFMAGRRADEEDWAGVDAYRQRYTPQAPAPAYVAPTYQPVALPEPAPPPAALYQQDIDAPSIAYGEAGAAAEPAYVRASLPDFTVRDDAAPDEAPLTDDLPAASVYDGLADARPAFTPVADTLDERTRTAEAPDETTDFSVPVYTVEDPTTAAPFTDALDETLDAAAPDAELPDVDEPAALPAPEEAAPEDAGTGAAKPDAPRDHLRARRRKHR